MTVFDPRWEFYAITDQASAQGRSDLAVAAALLRGGATCLQYRAKKVSAREQWETALGLRKLTLDAGVSLVINDRVDLALDCGADGVHLGQDDLPVASARRLARMAGRKDLVVGRSTHSLDQALEAEKDGADYVGYGPLYATQTKENNVPPVGPASLGEIVDALSIPVVAIGGIKLGRLPEVAGQRARHCAVVTALTGADDVEAAAREHLLAWRQAVAAAPRR
ncbi:MAG TPA: thiamine phosphate synthase [bacterium]|nr:thiamine phosphate synthase [bacterium]